MARVGVLALQGDFEAHRKALERAGAEAVEVRTASELDSVDGLVIPGGESTTMLKLLGDRESVRAAARVRVAKADFRYLCRSDTAGKQGFESGTGLARTGRY